MTRITDEAVDAALDVLFDHGHNGIKCYNPQSGLDATVRAALEAALPHLEGAPPDESEWADEERDFVELALDAADSGNAGHWPTVATYLAAEVRCLRDLEGAIPAIDRESIVAALAGKPILRSGDKPEGWRGSLTEEECLDVADVLLALIGGAS